MWLSQEQLTYLISAPGNGIGQEVACASTGSELAHGVAKGLLRILELPLLLAQLPDLHQQPHPLFQYARQG